MVLERIANPSSGESRFKSSSLFRTAKFLMRVWCKGNLKPCQGLFASSILATRSI